MAINWEDSYSGPGVDEYALAPQTPGGAKLDYSTPPSNPQTYTYAPGATYDEGGNYRPAVEPTHAGPTFGADTRPQAAATDWTQGGWDAERVRQYFASRGVTPNPTSPDYWAGKWQEWGSKDPAYFLQRLATADEFGGGWAGAPPPSGGSAPPVSSYDAQFSDPSTKLLEQLLAQQTAYYQNQRSAQEAVNARSQQRWDAANQSAADLVRYLQQRSAQLQQPAYTGAEGEVLRTRALDPIEADRQAARQRALGRVSQSGMELDSGVAQQLLNDVDASFDRQRAGAQNDLAYRQIQEERSRQQEVQSLLALIPEIQRAGAMGDVEFLQQLNASLNAPQLGAIATAQQLYQLPMNAAQQAMAAMGMAPSPENLLNGTIQLATLNQQGRQQGLGWYESIGALLPYLGSAFNRGGGGVSSPGNPFFEMNG